MNAVELAGSVSELLSLPDVYFRAQAMLDDPDSSTMQLADLVATDPALAARMLRLANSVRYRRRARVDRLSLAVSLLGRDELRSLVLAATAADVFRRIETELVDMSTFWYHSIYCGLVARELAGLCGMLHCERLFVAGLLHDVGQLVMYQQIPDQAQEILAAAPAVTGAMFRTEREQLGFTHAEVGAELLRQWCLPEALVSMIAFHHEPGRAGEGEREASLVHIANGLADAAEPGRYILECEIEIEPRAWQVTGLDQERAIPALEVADQGVLEMMELISPGVVVI